VIKKILLFLAFVVLALQLFFMQHNKQIKTHKKPVVCVSTFAISDITNHIAKDKIEVVNILPYGVSPHSFEPTPKLMIKIEKSALVIYNGSGLEPWTKGFHFPKNSLDLSKYVKLQIQTKHHHKEVHHDEHHHSLYNPHYWLYIDNMVIATNVITDALIKILPKEKQFFLQNKKAYITMLQNLKKEYASHLFSCKKDTLITHHDAFFYLAKKYHFKTKTLSGISPQALPSAKKITELMQLINQEHIHTIFFESFASDKVIKSIAKDTHIDVEVLHPLGNITANQAKQHLTYKDIMEENLQKISKALECQ